MTVAGALGWCIAAWGLSHGLLFFLELVLVWQTEDLGPDFSLATRGLISGGSLLSMALVIWRIDCPRDSLRKVVALVWPPWIWLALSVALAVCLHCTVRSHSSWQLGPVRSPAQVRDAVVGSVSQFRGVVAMASVCVLAPAAEEIFFRGGLLGRMKGLAIRRVGATALFFAMMHNQVSAWPGLFAIGAILGILRVTSQSLIPPLIVHCSYNTMELAGNPLKTRLETTMSDGQSTVVGALLVVGLTMMSYPMARWRSAGFAGVARR